MFLILAPVFHSLSCGSQYPQRRLYVLRIQGLACRISAAMLGNLQHNYNVDNYGDFNFQLHVVSYHIHSARLLGCTSGCGYTSHTDSTSSQLQLCCFVCMLSHKLTLRVMLLWIDTWAWLRGEIRASRGSIVISRLPPSIVRYWSVVRLCVR